jgi:hypothetical protein
VPHLGASQVALVQQLVGALRSLEHCVVAAAFTINRAARQCRCRGSRIGIRPPLHVSIAQKMPPSKVRRTLAVPPLRVPVFSPGAWCSEPLVGCTVFLAGHSAEYLALPFVVTLPSAGDDA